MANPLSRRDLFGLLRRPFETDSAGRSPLRPPGAIFEDRIADTCLRCGACVSVCPRQAIKPLDASQGERAGTPHIVPREAPCVLCNGLLCTTACPSGALRPMADAKEVRMGKAIINPKRCLPWQGQACTTCITCCPIPGALVAAAKGRPQVTAQCTGCGICEYYCPTTPAAIVVRPQAAP